MINKRNWDFWFSSSDDVVKTKRRPVEQVLLSVDDIKRVDVWSIPVVVSSFSIEDKSSIDSTYFSVVIVVEITFSVGLIDSFCSWLISTFSSAWFSTSVVVWNKIL